MYEISFNLASFLTNYFHLSVINLSSSLVHITSIKLLVILFISLTSFGLLPAPFDRCNALSLKSVYSRLDDLVSSNMLNGLGQRIQIYLILKP